MIQKNSEPPRVVGDPGGSPMSCRGAADAFKNNYPNLARQALRRGGRAPRAKGNRLERTIVRLFQEVGIGAERVPLSGSAGGSYAGDFSVPLLGRDLVIEA